MIFPVKNTMGSDFSGLNTLTPPVSGSSGDDSQKRGIVVIKHKALVGKFVERRGKFLVNGIAGKAFHHNLNHIGILHLPWKRDLTPAKLYRMDTNGDDQVEQLGLLTMLRLDVAAVSSELGP